MREAAERLGGLRASLALAGLAGNGDGTRVPLGHVAADACLKGGLRTGALHEIFSAAPGHEAAATGFAATLASRLGGNRRLLWVRQDFSGLEFGEISATGFLEFGIDPSRLLLFRAADVASGLRAAADALTCAALGAVVIEIPRTPKRLDLVTSRRLTLACAQNGVSALLLRFEADPDASAAETRWLVGAGHSSAGNKNNNNKDWGYPRFDAALTRNRHGTTGHWAMEWNCDRGRFNETADHRAVVSASADRPAAEAANARQSAA
ncbi:MAG TPA: hypothetical protein VGF97_02895 [Rhizomicrobium sp.]